MVEIGIEITPANQDAVNFVGTRRNSGICQLQVLISEGLKPEHTIFEIGCGALCGSIPIIRYLDSDKYCGTDPNEWLRADTLKVEQNRDILEKNPIFYSNDNFVPSNDYRFDYIFAHSIFNHAADWQWELFLDDIKKHMKDDTVIIISLLFAEGNTVGNPGYGIWPKDTATINSDKWMAQGIVYGNGRPRGDGKGKVNFKTKDFIFSSCKKRHLKCEISEKNMVFYKKHSGTNECKDWIRITKDVKI